MNDSVIRGVADTRLQGFKVSFGRSYYGFGRKHVDGMCLQQINSKGEVSNNCHILIGSMTDLDEFIDILYDAKLEWLRRRVDGAGP
jgi:hypothetical protein